MLAQVVRWPWSLAVPVEPDADQGRDWLIRELSDPIYQRAQPNAFDLIADALRQWLASLLEGVGGTPPVVAILIGLGLLAAVVAIAVLVNGAPRRNRRAGLSGEIFGEDEIRSAAELRRDAEAAARREDWVVAIADMFRAIARSLAEREAVQTVPGTTAHAFAGQAAAPFPGHAVGLAEAADAFDQVRYLNAPGSREAYRQVADLEAGLRAARPVLLEPEPAR